MLDRKTAEYLALVKFIQVKRLDGLLDVKVVVIPKHQCEQKSVVEKSYFHDS